MVKQKLETKKHKVCNKPHGKFRKLYPPSHCTTVAHIPYEHTAHAPKKESENKSSLHENK